MKSSHNVSIAKFTPLKKAYNAGDRDAVLTEIKKLGLVTNEVSFYAAWWRNDNKNEKSKSIEYKKETLEYLSTFFTWYFIALFQTHFTENMLHQAWDMFLIHTRQIDDLQKWGHRNYPTPLQFLFPEYMSQKSVLLNECYNNILNYLCKRQENNNFTVEELFHLSLHAIQKLEKMEIKPKKFQQIIEKMIIWLSDFSGENLDRALALASELSFYYRQANPTTTLHEIIANKNPKYDQHGNKIPVIFSDSSDGRDFSSGYQFPLFLQQLLNVDGRGTSVPEKPSDAKLDKDFIAQVAKKNGEIRQNTILSNAHTLYTLILLEDGKNKRAQNYYRKNVIKYSGEAKEQSICWYCENLPPDDKTSAKPVDLQYDLEEFRQAAQQYIDVQSSKKRYKNTGSKLAKLQEDVDVSGIAEAKLDSKKDTSGHIWKEAERIAKTDLSVDTSGYDLYYYQGSGSRVHFIVHDSSGEKITGFTRHMDHEKKLEQHVSEQQDELIRFGIALSSAQEIQEKEEHKSTHKCKPSI